MHKKWTDRVELTKKKLATVIVVLFLRKRRLKTSDSNSRALLFLERRLKTYWKNLILNSALNQLCSFNVSFSVFQRSSSLAETEDIQRSFEKSQCKHRQFHQILKYFGSHPTLLMEFALHLLAMAPSSGVQSEYF